MSKRQFREKKRSEAEPAYPTLERFDEAPSGRRSFLLQLGAVLGATTLAAACGGRPARGGDPAADGGVEAGDDLYVQPPLPDGGAAPMPDARVDTGPIAGGPRLPDARVDSVPDPDSWGGPAGVPPMPDAWLDKKDH